MGNNRITWNVGFNVDKSQLKEVNKELKALQNLTTGQLIELNPKLNTQQAEQALKDIKQDAIKIEQAFSKAFNSSLGTVNLKALNTQLDKMKDDLPRIVRSLSSAGVVGNQAFQRMASSIMGTKLQLKESNKLLDDMSKTMGNTIKWGITSRIFNGITESVQDAWEYTKRLDASLNDIRIVTGKSADEMERFARTANNAAQKLGKSTKDYTDAALIYYQQGLGEQEANKRAEITLKTASVTGQSTDTVSEQLTAVWNGYKVATEQTEATVDKLAAVAATTAADLEELSVGMSKVASAANIMGVDVDQLSATLSTVISVTRQAPETVGTAFKTIFARMGDIEAGLDGEVSLDKYTQDMLDVGGINVLDANNELRDMGDVLEEVGNKWSTMSREQQIALSQVMAGTRQYNNLLALFDNWDMYSDALVTSQKSLGTLQYQQDIYMERTSAHLHQLEAAWERVFDSFVDNEGVNSLIDVFTSLTNLLGNFTEAVGGGGTALMMFGAIATKILSKNMSQGIHTFMKNRGADENNRQEVQGRIDAFTKLQNDYGFSKYENDGKDINGYQVRIDELTKLRDNIKGLKKEEIETFSDMIENVGKATAEVSMLNEKIKQATGFLTDSYNADDNNTLNELTDKDTQQVMQKFLNNEADEKDRLVIESLIKDKKSDIKVQKEDLQKIMASENNIGTGRRSEANVQKLLKNYESMYATGETMSMNDSLRTKFETNRTQMQDVMSEIREEFYAAQVTETEKQKKKINDRAKRQTKKATTQTQKKEIDAQRKRDLKAVKEPTQIDTTKLDEFYSQLSSEFKHKFEQAILKIVRDGKEIVEDAVNENSRQIENIEEIQNGGGSQAMRDRKQTDLDNAEGDLTGAWDEEMAQRKIEQVTNFTAGVTELASAMMIIGSLPDIWDDESITTGEKVLQTIMAVGSAIGMMASGYTSVKTALDFLRPAKVADAAVTAAQTGANAANTASVHANKLAWLTHPIVGPLLLVITAVVAGILAGVSATENWTKKIRENNTATIEENNKKQELINTNRELIDSYKELVDGVQEGTVAASDLTDATKNLIDNYDNFVTSIDGTINANGELVTSTGEVLEGLDLTSLKANAAAKNYDELAKSVTKAQKALSEAGLTSAIYEKDAAGTNLESKAREGMGHYEQGGKYSIDFNGWSVGKNEEEKAWSIMAQDMGEYYRSGAKDFLGSAFVVETDFNAEEIVKLYDKLNAARSRMKKEMTDDELAGSGIYSQVNEWLNKMKEDVDIYKAALLDLEKYSKELSTLNLQEKAKNGDFKDKTYQEIQNEVIQDLKKMEAFSNKTDEELKTIADLQLKGISEDIDTLQESYTIIQDLLKKDSVFEGLDMMGRKRLNGLTNEQLVNLQKVNTSSSVSWAEKNDLVKLLNNGNIEEFNKKLAEMARKVDVATSAIGKATNQFASLQKAREYVEDGKSLDKDDFDQLSNEVKQFYTLMADGTYKMTGDAREFYQVIKEQEQKGFRAVLEKSTNPEELVSKEELRKAQTGLASTATSDDELEAMLNKGEIASTDYKTNYKRLKESELKDLDLEKDSIEIYAKEIEKTDKNLKKLRAGIADTNDEAEEAANLKLDEYMEDVAIAQMRLSRGAETIGEKWEDWNKVLKDSTDPAYADAVDELKDAVADLTNSSAEFISNDTITQHLSQIHAAAKGDTAALWELQKLVAQDYLVSLGVNLNEPEIKTAVDEMNSYLATLKPEDLQVGAVLNDDAFITRLNQLAYQTNMTTAEMAQYLGSLGMDAELTTQKKTVESVMHVPSYSFDFSLTKGLTATPHIEEVPYTHEIELAAIKTTAEGGSGVRVTSGGNISSNSASKGYARGKGKGSKSKADKMDRVNDKPDRYHQVDTQLSKIEHNLEAIQSQEEKLIGGELIENINAQLTQLDTRIDRLREKMEIAKGETDELRQKLSGQGVQFNDDGTIANYMQMYQAKVNYVNSLIDKYNKMSESEQEAYKETVEQAKEDLEQFTEDLDRYDELVSDFIPGLKQEIQDAIDEEIELNIKKFNMEFEIRLDMKEAQKDWNEFKKKILDGVDEDDIYGNARARAVDDFSNIIGKNGVQNSTKQTEDILAQLRQMDETGWSNVYGDNRAQALEDLQAAYQEIQADLLELDAIQEDVHQAWLDTMDEINDKMADQVAMYEQITNLIDHDMKVIELVYGEEDYEALGRYYEKQHQNNLDLLDFQKQNVEFWENEMNSIVDKNSEEWKKARDNWIAATNDLNATIEASIESARAKMENAIDDVFKKFNDKITGGMGLDYMQQQWDLINDNADDYLDTVNAAFGIRQLESKYQDAIDKTDNVSAQRKLNKLMEEELKALKEKDKLSEYDIERANRKYEIALKQIALEEAQQTKSTMRLRRDSQGNYRYEYVADEDNIQKLKDELDALENSLYNFDKDRWIEMQNQVVDAVRERQEAIKEIMMDASLSEEERIARLEEINQLYNEKIQNITDLTMDAQVNMYDSAAVEIEKIWRDAIADELEARGLGIDQINQLVEDGTLEEMSIRLFGSKAVAEMWLKAMQQNASDTGDATAAIINWFNTQETAFGELSQEEKRIMTEEMLPQFKSGVNEMIQLFTDEENGFEALTVASMKALSQATLDYKADLEAIQRAANTSFTDIRNGLDPAITKTQQLVKDNDKLNDEFTEQIELIKQLNQQLQNQIDKYSQISAAAKKAAEDAHKYWVQQQEQAAQDAAREKEKQNNNAAGNKENQTGTEGTSGGGDKGHTGSSPRPLNEDAYRGIATAIWVMGSSKSGWGTGNTRKARITEKFGAEYATKVQEFINANQKNAAAWKGSLDWGSLSNYYYSAFKTGGYTGDWGTNEGKVALLHEKELVLNAEDTKNMLDMMHIARSVMANAGPKVKALAAGRFTNNNTNSQLEQNVHIEANFPNVETASEIEEALNNLVQMASQRASRNLRG